MKYLCITLFIITCAFNSARAIEFDLNDDSEVVLAKVETDSYSRGKVNFFDGSGKLRLVVSTWLENRNGKGSLTYRYTLYNSDNRSFGPREISYDHYIQLYTARVSAPDCPMSITVSTTGEIKRVTPTCRNTSSLEQSYNAG